MLGGWLAVVALMALPVVIMAFLCSRSAVVRAALFPGASRGDRAFLMVSGAVSGASVAVAFAAWFFTNRADLFSSIVGLCGDYWLCAFVVRVLYIWRRGATSIRPGGS